MIKGSVVIANAIRIDNSIVACALIARFLREHLSCEVVDAADVPLKRSRYATLIMINSPWGFCSEEHRVRVRQLLWSARRVVWVQNDYNSGIGPRSFKSMGAWLDGEGDAGVKVKHWSPNPLHEPASYVRQLTLWTTIPAYVERGYVTAKIPLDERSAYVNWNALHYGTKQQMKPYAEPYRPHNTLFYFGAYRPERAERFAKYLMTDSYPVTISTAVGRSVERFTALSDESGTLEHPTIEAREQNLVARLGTEWATIYIEDKRADELYVSPAGRFYEALSAGVAQFIDADAVPNLERAGFVVDPMWTVTTALEVKVKLRYAPTIARAQRRAWATPKINRRFAAQLQEALTR